MPTYPKRLAVTNPSFETGVAPGDGWTTVNGTPVFKITSPPTDIRGGSRYLQVANNGSAGSYRVRQDVAVPADCLTDVDAGLLSVSLRVLWSNFAAGNDIGFVEVAFLDVADALISTASSGNFPDSAQAWGLRAHTPAIPAGTRKLRLILGGTWVTGTSTDSYFDIVDAELVLSTPPAGDLVQLYGEALLEAPSPARAAQAYTEALLATASSGRAAQIYAELIRSVADKPATAGGGTIVCVVTG